MDGKDDGLGTKLTWLHTVGAAPSLTVESMFFTIWSYSFCSCLALIFSSRATSSGFCESHTEIPSLARRPPVSSNLTYSFLLFNGR